MKNVKSDVKSFIVKQKWPLNWRTSLIFNVKNGLTPYTETRVVIKYCVLRVFTACLNDARTAKKSIPQQKWRTLKWYNWFRKGRASRARCKVVSSVRCDRRALTTSEKYCIDKEKNAKHGLWRQMWRQET